MAKVVIANRANVANGEILSVHDDNEPLGFRQTMQRWIESGGTRETWSGHFVMVHVTDKTKEELTFLTERLIKEINGELESVGNKYYFQRPENGSDLFNAFDLFGQVSVPWTVAQGFLLERT